ncbi:hypothetical protein [Geothrix sp. PMB-07]|uniref:hypothetical protein n=1 Tax=Geothrix sp. PMB-07 TaxID=3068640 RepID=UPI0027405874|nr:hypothetical protein [Geothrix sp. PMB-07]WLT30075.1 hypothetical protein Q9293_10135 [Geothrix sp. PMB-07]
MRALEETPIHSLPGESSGYGLIGPVGCGKTWSLIQRIAQEINAYVLDQDSPETAWLKSMIEVIDGIRYDVCRSIVWVSWPDQAENLKRMVLDAQAVSEWVKQASECWLLVLDDLGAERVRGVDDFSRSVLAEVIDSRYRNEEMVCWTSNLSAEELAVFYRGRIASRLLSAWPPFELEGPDMRLQAISPLPGEGLL